MKKLFTLLAVLLSLGYAVNAQVSTDLAVLNSFKSVDTVKWDPKGTHGRIIYYAFINYGPTALVSTDSLYWKNPILGNVRLSLPTAGFPVNDTLYFTDTLFQNTAVSPNPYTWCDSIWAKRGGVLITDPVMSNNSNCKSVRFIQTSPVGVETVAAQASALSVYPNPASNSVSFSFEFGGNGTAGVSLVDLLGKAVLQQDLGKVASGKRTYSIDISSLQSGVYFLELVENGNKAVSRIVIQK
jgi:hypothetical protein